MKHGLRKKTATIYNFHRKKWKVTMMLWIGTMKLWWCIRLRKWSNAWQILNAITFLSCHLTKSLGSFIYFMMIMNTLKKRLQMQQKLPQKRQRSLRILTVMRSLAISWRSKSNRNNNSNWKKNCHRNFPSALVLDDQLEQYQKIVCPISLAYRHRHSAHRHRHSTHRHRHRHVAHRHSAHRPAALAHAGRPRKRLNQ